MTSEPALFEVDNTLTVGELTRRLAASLRRTFPQEVWLRGQIRNLSRSARGHVYFDLIEPIEGGQPPKATVSVVLFDSTRQIVNRILKRNGAVRMDDGVEIRIRGEVDYFAPQGRLQLKMSTIDPEFTLGRLAADRTTLLSKLATEGLLEANGSIILTIAPLRIALVTSAGSAAAADFEHQLATSPYCFDVSVFDSRVQGEFAAESVTEAIEAAVDHGAEVIALVRGGGARTDLVTFDSELVARAIATCPIPVLTGIGHEIDRSIADEVAYDAHKTPTACAQFLIDRVAVVDRRFADCAVRLRRAAGEVPQQHRFAVDVAASQVAERAALRLGSASGTTELAALRVKERTDRALANASSRLERHDARLAPAATSSFRTASRTVANLARRVERSSASVLRSGEARLALLEARTNALDPAVSLARGWSITTDETGRAVRSAAAVAAGTTLTTRLADGTITSTVTVSRLDPIESDSI